MLALMWMSTLFVRNLPDDVHEAMRELARQRQSSVNAETIRLLKRALRLESRNLDVLFDDIEAHRPKPRGRSVPSASALIREYRRE